MLLRIIKMFCVLCNITVIDVIYVCGVKHLNYAQLNNGYYRIGRFGIAGSRVRLTNYGNSQNPLFIH
jgi:hypothetical protein